MSRVEGQTALVTGAGSGIGQAIALALAAEGASVVITDVDAESAQRTAAQVEQAGGRALAVVADVSSEDDWRRVVQTAEGALGPVDILVNNAGFQHVASLDVFPTEVFRRMLDVMLVGAFLGMKATLPAMKARRRGRVINMASINGLVGFAGKAAYNAAKHGLIGLTRVAALETAPYDITVNALCPGYVDTPLVRNQVADLAKTRHVPEDRVLDEVILSLVPQRRLLDPKEVAAYALFLASAEGRSITGQAVVIDGGYTAQ
jgi:3-hydroxybutyrate dehydrogenase